MKPDNSKQYKRGRPSNKTLNRPVDFRNLRVIALRDGGGDVLIMTLALSVSDTILAGIAITDALTVASCSPGAIISRPIIEHDGQPALVARVQAPPQGLKIGSVIHISAVFRLDHLFDALAIEAAVSKIRVCNRPSGPAKITLPHIGALEQPIAVELTDDPRAQYEAETAIRRAAVHVEVADADLHVAHVVDRGIHQELVRLASRPARDRKPSGAAA